MQQHEMEACDRIMSNTSIIRWRLLHSVTLLLLLLLTVSPAKAFTEYRFSPTGSLPVGCTLNLSSSTEYTCGAVVLGVGDIISVGSFTPVTVTFTGAFTTAVGNLINIEGTSSDLNFFTAGSVTLGANTILNANVMSTSSINMGIGSTIRGNITASSTTGVVNLGVDSTVGGFIHTDDGAVNIGGSSNVAGGISTEKGVVTLLTNIEIGGGISTQAGAITIGNGSTTCDSVISTGSGVITITTNIQIGGDISTQIGAITINSGSTVAGDIISKSAGVVTLTNNKVGGDISIKDGAITLTDTQVGGSFTASGNGIVTLNNSFFNDTTLVLPPQLDCPVTPSVEYIQIKHDGKGLTCASESLTLKACTDATCSTLHTDAIDVQLSINGIFDQTITVTGGMGVVDFSYRNANTARLSLDQTFECKNGNSASCDVTFTDAGFRFLYGAAETTSISHQTSGNNFVDILKLQAVENINGVCSGLFTGNVDVELSQQNIIPSSTSGLSFKIGGNSGTSIDKHPTYTPNITLNFSADSKATISSPVYLDAGHIRLHARYNVADVSLIGNSTDFWVSPAKLVVTATSGGSNISGNSNSSTIIHKAGQAFDFTVTAYNSLGSATGNITANYVPNDIQLLLTRIGPMPEGVNGVFNYGSGSVLSNLNPIYQSTTLTMFNAGVSSTNSASYSEVGLLNLDLQDVDYGFSGNKVVAEELDIGRFTPDHFEQSVIEQGSLYSVCDQATLFAYTGQVLVSDAEKGAISYLINPVVELTAKNVQGVTTQNYTQPDYNKLNANANFIITPTTDTSILGKDNHLLPLTANLHTGTLSHDGLAASEPGFGSPLSAGILHYRLANADNFFYPRSENSEIIAQNNNIDFLIDQVNFVDSDGIAITSPEDITLTTSINLRFGRAFLKNSFGPETENFRQHFLTQYLNVNGRYVVNQQDSCTKYDADNITITSGTLNKNLTAANAVIGQLQQGETRMMILTAPGADNQGTINIEYDIYTWLEYDWNWNGIDTKSFDTNPSATATFGLFRGNDRIVQQREIFH